MIEDDLRTVIGQTVTDTAIYSRLIPRTLPQCITVQAQGGTTSTSTIRRASHTVVLMAVADDREISTALMRQARDALIQACPCDVSGTHYYHARAQAEGCITQSRPAPGGTAYVAHVTMEVLASL